MSAKSKQAKTSLREAKQYVWYRQERKRLHRSVLGVEPMTTIRANPGSWKNISDLRIFYIMILSGPPFLTISTTLSLTPNHVVAWIVLLLVLLCITTTTDCGPAGAASVAMYATTIATAAHAAAHTAVINYSHSRNPPCAPARTHGRIQAPREPPN
jgi:hypothetical protein